MNIARVVQADGVDEEQLREGSMTGMHSLFGEQSEEKAESRETWSSRNCTFSVFTLRWRWSLQVAMLDASFTSTSRYFSRLCQDIIDNVNNAASANLTNRTYQYQASAAPSPLL